MNDLLDQPKKIITMQFESGKSREIEKAQKHVNLKQSSRETAELLI